jgi:pullulanase/glycogen debranching enzyme
LLPIHYHINDHFLVEKGLVNYWGYNTLGYFAPDPRYASGGPRWAVQEFKSMVRTLHSEGLEVILDVVYNHTAEGDHLGPTLSLRGIDNAAYYRLAEDRSRYVDFTGCGNSLDCAHPHALQLIMDSLNLKDLYWLTPNGTEMADADWNADHARCLGMGLMGEQIDETDEHGQRITGDSFLILFNVDHESVLFRLGGRARGLNWELMFDTSGPDLKSRCLKRLDDYLLQGRTIAVLRPELPPSAQTMNLGI